MPEQDLKRKPLDITAIILALITLIGTLGSAYFASKSEHSATSAQASAARAATVAVGTYSFSRIGGQGPVGTYPDVTEIIGANADKGTKSYRIHRRFDPPFADEPLVVLSTSGLNLSSPSRFKLYATNITKDGFDLDLKVWDGTDRPDTVDATWIATKR